MAKMNVGEWKWDHNGIGGQGGDLSVSNIQTPNGFLTTSFVYNNKHCLAFGRVEDKKSR